MSACRKIIFISILGFANSCYFAQAANGELESTAYGSFETKHTGKSLQKEIESAFFSEDDEAPERELFEGEGDDAGFLAQESANTSTALQQIAKQRLKDLSSQMKKALAVVETKLNDIKTELRATLTATEDTKLEPLEKRLQKIRSKIRRLQYQSPWTFADRISELSRKEEELENWIREKRKKIRQAAEQEALQLAEKWQGF